MNKLVAGDIVVTNRAVANHAKELPKGTKLRVTQNWKRKPGHYPEFLWVESMEGYSDYIILVDWVNKAEE